MNIKCVDYRPTQGKTIKALTSFKFLNLGLELRDIAYHEDSGCKWLVMPRNRFFKDGKRRFYYYALFPDKRDFQTFSKIALKEIENFLNRREGRSDEANL
jgi:hypothetical protein